MYTHVMLNVPLKNEKNIGSDFIETNQKAVANNTGHGHGLDWDVACAMLLQCDDNIFLSQSKVHYAECGKNDPNANYIVILTVDVKFENYNQELQRFLKALTPYIVGDYRGDVPLFIGTSQDEEDDIPKLIFFDNDKQEFVFKTVSC